MVKVNSNAPKVPTGSAMTPAAGSSTLASNIEASCHDRPASAKGTEFSVRLNDGTGMCK